MPSQIKRILNRWRSDPTIADNVVEWRVLAAKPADMLPFPAALSTDLISVLQKIGIFRLYSHQVEAFESALQGENLAVVSGTASGKTLCYNLPVIDRLIKQPAAKALYLYPTKALAQDQLSNLNKTLDFLENSSFRASVYDGDTPTHLRASLRQDSSLILSNPDMLHTGILPHHTGWKDFFAALSFIIIDEMHTYRGVFGSHVANVIRRLKRICHFYGAQPQFILTSATIANPKELAERLIESPVKVIDSDGSPHGERHFLIYNPPFVDQRLGIRKSSLMEGTRLAGELIDEDIQTIVFGRTRRGIELALTYLRQKDPAGNTQRIRGYRSGYLPRERRTIEEGLRSGDIKAVVATNALELGIDIGGMDASVLIGYPGSVAGTLQQAGRAGRKLSPSIAVMITAANAMDQYLARHPEYIFERTPEQALIEPNNLLILLAHIRCAAFELPFTAGETFGTVPGEGVQAFLTMLAQQGDLHQQEKRFFWMSEQYPASGVSLRNATPDNISLLLQGAQGQQTIGQVDLLSAYWMVHPEAIYLHEGASYLVETLDFQTGVAHLRQASVDYYTQANQKVEIEEQSLIKQTPITGAIKSFGELIVTTQVTGYRKIRWFTHEIIGGGEVDLPATQLNTIGYWVALSKATVKKLKDQMMWRAGANDYGPNWASIRRQVLERDNHTCQVCRYHGNTQSLHVHHIQPFRSFINQETANHLQNLITLCPSCHRLAETNVRIRSGIAGIRYLLHNLAPLLLMCDGEDIGVHSDPNSALGSGQPTIIFYDNIPGGLGLTNNLYERHYELFSSGYETISQCDCADGCPSCVGPIGEEGSGGKQEALAIFKALIKND